MVVLLVLSGLMPVVGLVPVKMLPFDNENEFQIVVDMPEGTTLETTDGTLRALTSRLPARCGGNQLRHLRRNRLPDGFQRHGAALLHAHRARTWAIFASIC